jgi:hypothetical protein
MLDSWFDIRLKERLSVSSSEKRSRRFISNLGCCLLVGCEKYWLFAGKPVISLSLLASTSPPDVDV